MLISINEASSNFLLFSVLMIWYWSSAHQARVAHVCPLHQRANDCWLGIWSHPCLTSSRSCRRHSCMRAMTTASPLLCFVGMFDYGGPLVNAYHLASALPPARFFREATPMCYLLNTMLSWSSSLAIVVNFIMDRRHHLVHLTFVLPPSPYYQQSLNFSPHNIDLHPTSISSCCRPLLHRVSPPHLATSSFIVCKFMEQNCIQSPRPLVVLHHCPLPAH